MYGKRNFEYCVKSMLSKCNQLFLNSLELHDNPKDVLYNFTHTLHEKECQKWYQELWNDRGKPNGNKLRMYRNYKSMYEVEKYVLSKIPRYKSRYFAMLRAGSLPLAVETGRYSHPVTPLNDRICKFCNANTVEDEKHFLLSCNAYSDIRQDFIANLGEKWNAVANSDSSNPFNFLMSEKDVVFNTINLVYYMTKRRKILV
jgi:hypothetical protein